MKSSVKRLLMPAALTAVLALSGCATIKANSAAICRIRFDYADKGIEGLNLQNLRALVAFKEVCRKK